MENFEKENEIFISYRRADIDFTKKMYDGLKQAELTVWVDWDDIPPGVEGFTDEIQRGIEGAVAFVCILSPSYLKSEYCIMELKEAIRLKKRIVPVVLEKFEPMPAPEGIGHINWVYFTPHAGQENTFEESFPKVLQAIKADYEHSREHTRLLQRAINWQKNDQGRGYLLKEAELQKAERWQAAAAGKTPALTELQGEYILASRKDSTRRSRTTLMGVSVALVISIALAVAAVIQWREAVKQSNLSQSRALVVNTQLSGSKIVSNLLLSLTSFNLVKKYDYPDRIVAEQSLRDSLSKESGIPLGNDTCPITNLTFSPDGNWMATGSNGDIACLWNAKDFTKEPIVLQDKDIYIFAPTFSPDSKWLATAECIARGGACAANIIHVWDMQNSVAPPIVLTGQSANGLSNFAFIPGSSRLVISDANTIYIWDLTNPSVGSISLQQEDLITSLAVSRNGDWLVTGSWDKVTRLWDLQNLSAGSSALPGIDIVVNSFASSADGQWLAAGGEDGNVYLWDTKDLSSEPTILPAYTFPGKAASQINSLAFSPDSHWLATGTGGLLTLWDMEDQSKNITFDQISGNVGDIAFSPDGQWVSTGLNLWSIKNPRLYQKPILLSGLDSVNSAAFSKDSRWLAAAGEDGIARLWDLKSTDPEFFFLHPLNDGVDMTSFSPDGRWLLAHDFNKTVRLWDIKNPSTNPISLDNILFGSAFSPDSRWLVMSHCEEFDALEYGVCNQGSVSLRDLTNPSVTPKLILDHPVSSFVFSQNGQWLATDKEVLKLNDLSAKPITPGGNFDSLVAFSPDSQWLAGLGSLNDNSIALLWNMKDLSTDPVQLKGEDPSQLQDVAYPGLKVLAFSPDGQWIAASECTKQITSPGIFCLRSAVRLWEVQNPSKEPITSEIDSDDINGLVFSHNNRWLVSASVSELYLWDLKDLSKAPVDLVSSLGHRVGSVAFSPNDQWLAIARYELPTILLNMNYLTNDPIVLNGQGGDIRSLAFSPDGQWLATGSDDATVRIWSMDTEHLLQVGCQITGRNFTREEWKKYFPGQDYPARLENSTCPTWHLEAAKTPIPYETPEDTFLDSLQPVSTVENRPIEGAITAESSSTDNVILKDDFSSSNSNWSTGTDTDSSIEYANDALHVIIYKKNWFTWSTPDNQSYENIHMEVTVTNNNTDPTTTFGIMCNQQTEANSFYYFGITPGGEYAVVKATNGEDDVILTNNNTWMSSDLITPNASSYRLGIDCGNGTLALYVDGKQIDSVSDSTYPAGGVGLFIWSGEDATTTDLTLDDFLLAKLGPQEETVPTETPPQEGAVTTVLLAADASNTYTEEFDGNMDAWSNFMTTGVDKQVKPTLENGHFGIKLSQYEDSIPRVYWVNDSFAYSNVQIEAVVTNNGNTENGVSLICQQNDRGWYEFTISNGGLYTIYTFDTSLPAKKAYAVLANGGISSIKVGKETNTYTAVCTGNQLSLYVNEHW